MRIAYVITRADAVGGASVHVRDLARAMLDRGHDAIVLCGGEGPVTEQFQRAGVPFQPLRHLGRPIRPARDFWALAELGGALKKLRPDLVSTHTAKAGWIGRAAASRLGLPVVYTPHGWTIAGRLGRGTPLFRAAERLAARWASAIVCVCEYERRLALEHRIAPADRLVVVHNGVRDIPPELRATPETSPVRIISVARFEPPKDHATLLRGLARLASLPWTLELVGDGPLEPEVRRLAGDLGIGGRVLFAGYQPDPAHQLARSHLFILCSRSEGFPRSVLEAMRAGLPVVASDVGGAREAVEDRVSGRLVPAGDIDSLTAALGELIENGALRQQFGHAARGTYEAKFGIDRMVEETLVIYEQVQRRRERRP
jgi:glycosyltransferase involved in cell wall biosynthesis